ncbi:MAG: four helix bundle protein [Planctomycetes bacterium]|nr:four helix bundle protein [Planctomycetota bacterium]
MEFIRGLRDLRVFVAAEDSAMVLFEWSRSFPQEEIYSLTTQLRRASRSVCANIAEAWRKRRYPKHFVSKLSDAEAEAEETRVWIGFAARCGYVDPSRAQEMDRTYDQIIAQLVSMIAHPEQWCKL